MTHLAKNGHTCTSLCTMRHNPEGMICIYFLTGNYALLYVSLLNKKKRQKMYGSNRTKSEKGYVNIKMLPE